MTLNFDLLDTTRNQIDLCEDTQLIEQTCLTLMFQITSASSNC